MEKLKKFNKDIQWFQNHYSQLKKGYKGKYVAIKNGQVVDSDADVHILLDRLQKDGFDTSTMLVEHVNEHRVVYVL